MQNFLSETYTDFETTISTNLIRYDTPYFDQIIMYADNDMDNDNNNDINNNINKKIYNYDDDSDGDNDNVFTIYYSSNITCDQTKTLYKCSYCYGYDSFHFQGCCFVFDT